MAKIKGMLERLRAYKDCMFLVGLFAGAIIIGWVVLELSAKFVARFLTELYYG